MSITRRTAIGAGSAALLSGCDKITENESVRSLLTGAEQGNFVVQRALSDRMALAREFAPEQRSPIFRANGTREPEGEAYAAHVATDFATWSLAVDGLVEAPQNLSLAQLKAMPQRSQITRHDCVEGWSAIGKWTGVPLKLILDEAKLSRDARYLVFHCADQMKGDQAYYESIDLIDAHHPQTILAWALNDVPLPVGNGAPLRLRVERQLGYKQAKYVQRIEAVASLAGIGSGKGGYWEDRSGYQWYAGI
jgi:DMSO/TMAO reductase YedYZ molybdopterin-dependent catalytic subunit